MTDGAVITLASLLVGSVVWLVRQEGRINGHDRELRDIKDANDTAVQTIRRDVEYIRERIDRVLEHQR
jgi:hypothetical protein